MAGPGLILERAAVPFNDARGNRKAEAGAGFLRAEKRIEQAFLDVRWNAFARVAHFKNHSLRFAPCNPSARRAGAKHDRPGAIDRFSAVANEIDQDLLQMSAIRPDVHLG